MRKTSAALLAVAALAVAAGSASAQSLNATFNFDTLGSGNLASQFNTALVTFHNAKFTPSLDGAGDPIPGTDHWQIDAANDSAFPLTVEDPSLYGRGSAPSGAYALNGLSQEILIQFDRPYDLSSFSVTLDNDTFGSALAQISYITGTSTLLSVGADQTVAGLTVSQGAVAGVTGIVLPAGAFYDNVSVAGSAAVPEPSTWAAVGGAAALGVAILRRRRAQA